MVNGVVLTMLTMETVADVRSKSISVIRQIIFIIVGIALNVIFYYQSLVSIAGGIGIAAVLFLYAKFTEEGIGYGDCLIFLNLGIYIGFLNNMRLLFGSLVIGSVIGVGYAIIKRKNLDSRIPFVPCILAAYIVMTILQYLNGGFDV